MSQVYSQQAPVVDHYRRYDGVPTGPGASYGGQYQQLLEASNAASGASTTDYANPGSYSSNTAGGAGYNDYGGEYAPSIAGSGLGRGPPAPAPAGDGCVRIDSSLFGQYTNVLPYQSLNRVQTHVFHTVFETDENVAVAAPTGVGKTVLFELAIIRLLMRRDGHAAAAYVRPPQLDDEGAGAASAAGYNDSNYNTAAAGAGSEHTYEIIPERGSVAASRGRGRGAGVAATASSGKIVYLSPLKALCMEKQSEWSVKFGKHGVRVVACTGDSDGFSGGGEDGADETGAGGGGGGGQGKYDPRRWLTQVAGADIIVTTPEKWDAMTRR